MLKYETKEKPTFPDENTFLRNPKDCYGIYQLKAGADCHTLRFASLAELRQTNQGVEKEHYDLVYTGDLPEKDPREVSQILEDLYVRFNLDYPGDFYGHSLSVSDVVALKQNGKLTAWYTDSFGFEKLRGFIPENALKNAEMSLEDDYGMIDGIINNGPRKSEPPVLDDTTEIIQKAKPKHRESPER